MNTTPVIGSVLYQWCGKWHFRAAGWYMPTLLAKPMGVHTVRGVPLLFGPDGSQQQGLERPGFGPGSIRDAILWAKEGVHW